MPPKHKRATTSATAATPLKRKSLADLDVQVDTLPEPLEYTPLDGRYEHDAESLLPQQPTCPLEYFSYFFNAEIWEVLCEGTNAYYTSQHRSGGEPSERGWEPVTVREMKIWIGLVIYMGIVVCPSVEDYWAEKTRQRPMEAMEQNRFEQIQRYLHISLPTAPPAPAETAWYKKLEPMASMLANSFRSAYKPSSNCAIDESVLNEGYKIYAICDHGYTYGFEFYSRVNGFSGNIGDVQSPMLPPMLPPTLPPTPMLPPPPSIPRTLTPTSTTCLRLAKLLPYNNFPFTIFCDSFFSNTSFFAALRDLGIGACGSARKAKLPIELQQYDGAHGKDAEWGDLASVSHDTVLCTRWQDNAGVFVLTTIHDLNDGVVSNRKRPKKGNPAVRQVDVRKLLTTPPMINDFNNHMEGVDIANQLRSYYPQLSSRRSWMPLFYWLLDTALINSYILYRMSNPSAEHQQFRLDVLKALLCTLDHTHGLDMCGEGRKEGGSTLGAVSTNDLFISFHSLNHSRREDPEGRLNDFDGSCTEY